MSLVTQYDAEIKNILKQFKKNADKVFIKHCIVNFLTGHKGMDHYSAIWLAHFHIR